MKLPIVYKPVKKGVKLIQPPWYGIFSHHHHGIHLQSQYIIVEKKLKFVVALWKWISL